MDRRVGTVLVVPFEADLDLPLGIAGVRVQDQRADVAADIEDGVLEAWAVDVRPGSMDVRVLGGRDPRRRFVSVLMTAGVVAHVGRR